MSKKFIHLNNNEEHLSLGNLFRIIKEMAINKTSALQTEIFCTIFDIKDINDTTVNNYCLGARGIGSDYKQIFINKEKRYKTNYQEFCDTIINIINILDGLIYTNVKDKVNFINNNVSAIYLSKKLYNLAKNDKQVSVDFSKKLKSLIDDTNIYECLIQELLFTILEKKQPLYEEVLKREVIENILNDTSISSVSLEEYLSLKLREGFNYDYSMKILANEGNSYALHELGCNEYYGYVKRYPRYDEALKYFIKSAEFNHASSCYMVGRIYIEGLVGGCTNCELQKGYEYLLKAYNLGNVAAINMLGNMYYKGIYPLKKDEAKAIELYKLAAKNNYVYAFNNLGKIEESHKNMNKAISFYQKSADLGESWACNKIGEYYRSKDNLKEAYYYYNKAIDANYRTTCYYAYYNLAKYYFLNGYDTVKKDEAKALEYLNLASNNHILEATILLFFIYVVKYKESKNANFLKEIEDLKLKIELNKKYTSSLKVKIEKEIKTINSIKSIDISYIM